MSRKLVGIMLVMLVAVAISLAGCTDIINNITGTGTGTGTGPTLSATPGATGQADAGGDTTTSKLYDLNKFKWFTQRTTSTGVINSVSNEKYEISTETYAGKLALHTKVTSTEATTTEFGSSETKTSMDIYTDKATGDTLGGTMTIQMGDGEPMTTEIGPTSSNKNFFWAGGQGAETNVAYVGPDVVTIDGKTYACSKYKHEIPDSGTVTHYWNSPGVPVVVKIVVVVQGETATTITTELTGWGN